jgi:hypothetical protein
MMMDCKRYYSLMKWNFKTHNAALFLWWDPKITKTYPRLFVSRARTGINEFFRASPVEMLYLYSQFSFFFALFFWGWAGYNTMSMSRGMDLGIFSFASVLLTSSYFLVKKGRHINNTVALDTLPPINVSWSSVVNWHIRFFFFFFF